MSEKADLAVKCFGEGFSCAQAVFTSYCEDYNLDKETALKIAGAFGGGMGYIGETCGAITGAFMLIGLKYGKYRTEDNVSKDKTYSAIQEFTRRFKAEFGSVKCTELIKYDLSIAEELNKAKEAEAFKHTCSGLVKRAVEIIEEIL
ncbi:MAG TPA: hypothetical protein DHV55_08405 [Clostridiaceae bacterium]|nr:hypothetical protein [Clostridiaceae bacterium]